jgi:hypothetical protein
MKEILPRKNKEGYSNRKSSDKSIAFIFRRLAVKAEEKTQFKQKPDRVRGFWRPCLVTKVQENRRISATFYPIELKPVPG